MTSLGLSIDSVAALGGVSFTLASLGASLLHWFRPEDATGVAASGNWAANVGGATAAQATGGARPAYSATGHNGRPCLTFDGGDSLAASFSAISQPGAVIVACQVTSVADFRFVVDSSHATNRWAIYTSITTGLVNGFAGSAITSGSGTLGSICVVSAVFNGASSVVRINGVQVASGNAGAATMQGITIGASSSGASGFLIGSVGDIAICSSLSAAQLAASERYVGARAGVIF